MNCLATVPDHGCLLDCFDAFMASERPTLDDILGAACELYCTDPDELGEAKARPALRAYCYFAARWSREPFSGIGAHVRLDRSVVNSMSRQISWMRRQDMIVRDDIDLLAVRIVERVLIRKRLAKCRT